MPLIDLVTLPVRVTVAAAQVTLGLGQLMAPDGPVRRDGGYADRLMLVIGEGGHVERVSRVLSDPNGPVALVNALAGALSEDRPLGRALAEDGTLDRLLAAGGALDRLTREDGVLERLLREEGLLERLLAEDGFVEKLTADGGTLDQLIALGTTLEAILPRLAELSEIVPELHASVDALGRAVEPLSGLAVRLPGSRRRTAIEA